MIDPILILGGSGAMGSATARLLRDAHPSLPLVIGARDQGRASAAAQAVDNAAPAIIDLSRRDLGLAHDQAYSAVVVALRDTEYNSIRFAQDRGIGIILLSEAAFELAPIISLYVTRPTASPIVILGHSHGGIPSLVAAALVADLPNAHAIRIGVIFDPEDPLPPGAQVDMAEIVRIGPPPLVRRGRRWQWLGDDAPDGFNLQSAAGEVLTAEAYGLPDVLSLARIAPDMDITLLAAEGRTASDARGRPGHEVVIEIDTTQETRRWRFVDPDGNAMLGARGIMLAAERLAGLRGTTPPGGLYFPEHLISPEDTIGRLGGWGITVVEEPLPDRLPT